MLLAQPFENQKIATLHPTLSKIGKPTPVPTPPRKDDNVSSVFSRCTVYGLRRTTTPDSRRGKPPNPGTTRWICDFRAKNYELRTRVGVERRSYWIPVVTGMTGLSLGRHRTHVIPMEMGIQSSCTYGSFRILSHLVNICGHLWLGGSVQIFGTTRGHEMVTRRVCSWPRAMG